MLRENKKPSGLFIISSATVQSMVAAKNEKNFGRMNCGGKGERTEREREGEVVILMPYDA